MFSADAYSVERFTVAGQDFAVRAWRALTYCASPAEDIQRLDLYAPECFFHGEALNGCDAATAPIFMPNTVGGYMPGCRLARGNPTRKPSAS